MADDNPDLKDSCSRRRTALSTWETEEGREGAGTQRSSPSSTELSHVPSLTDAELIQLRIRVIALENLVISLLAQASDRQLEAARQMPAYISPRAGFTQHPLTTRAAHQMADLIERAAHLGMTRAQ